MSVTTTEKISEKIASSIQQITSLEADIPRKEALETFRKLGLPAQKNEEYKHTPITRYLEKNFTFAPSPAPGPVADVKKFFIPGLEANVIVFIDGIFSRDHSTIVSPSSEIFIQPLDEALVSKNEVALQHFSKYTHYSADALTAWNRAAWRSGLFIHVPDKTIVEKPVVIYNINNGTAGEIVAINRNLVVMGKHAQATVIEKFDSAGEANHFTNLVTEVVIGENAGLEFYSIQHDLNNRFQHALTEIYQKNSSRVNTYTFTLHGKFFRNNLHLQLDGEGIESHMYGLYLLNNDTLADNHTVVDHKKANSFSNELYKGIMDDTSKGVFN